MKDAQLEELPKQRKKREQLAELPIKKEGSTARRAAKKKKKKLPSSKS